MATDSSTAADELAGYERYFRRAGLPLFVADRSATRDVFTRAVPFFAVVFVGEMLTAARFSWPWWQNALAVAGGLIVLIGAFGGVNKVRGRRLLALPNRFGVPELCIFVILPALLPVIFNARPGKAGITAGANLAVVGLAYVVIAYGLPAIGTWAVRRLASQLATSLSLLTKALPLLMIFALALFLTADMWQVFGPMSWWRVLTIAVLFALLGLAFLVMRLPREVRRLAAETGDGTELTREERFNVGLVLLGGQALQVLVVSLGVGLFFVVFGALAINSKVLVDVWGATPGHRPPHQLLPPHLPFLGPHHVQISMELLRVSTTMAAFTGLYFAIAVLTDSTYRGEFLDSVTGDMRDVFRMRARYRALRQSAPVTAPQPHA